MGVEDTIDGPMALGNGIGLGAAGGFSAPKDREIRSGLSSVKLLVEGQKKLSWTSSKSVRHP